MISKERHGAVEKETVSTSLHKDTDINCKQVCSKTKEKVRKHHIFTWTRHSNVKHQLKTTENLEALHEWEWKER